MDPFVEFLGKVLSPVQLIGYIGMACAFISYQCKKNTTYFIFQTGCGLFFGLQFLCLGSWAGVLLNVVAVARGIIMGLGDKCKKWYWLVLIEIGFVVAALLSVFVFDDPWYIGLLLFIAQAGGTLFMWTRDGKKIRMMQLCLASPIWLFHNIFYKLSVGGIICEVFNMTSVAISLVRFRKTGFDKK